jgi:hypothetical protein
LIPVELDMRLGVGGKGKRIVAPGVGDELLDDLVCEEGTSVSSARVQESISTLPLRVSQKSMNS